jgi:hypothetical protein
MTQSATLSSIGASPLANSPRPKAYSYIRFSTKRQALGNSLMRQLDRSREYAAKHGLDLQEKTF